MKSQLAALWRFRGFILGNVKREFQLKYRNSLLGAAWTVINPLAMILVYTVIFSQIMQARLGGSTGQFSYSIYLCSGILFWGLFTEIVTRSQMVFIENANLLKKLNFPKLCLPVTVVINGLVNFSIIFGLFTLFLIVTGNFPGFSYFAILPVLLIQITFSIGLGLSLGVLNVFFRDIGQLFGIVLQFWFWFTPIVYPRDSLPEWVKELLVLNPMASIINAYQTILVKKLFPDWATLLPQVVLTILICFVALRLVRKRSGEMVDEL